MSRRTKYVLKLSKFGIQLKISIGKSYDEKTGFTQTYPDANDPTINRVVRTIKVVTADGIKPADISDIEVIVPWTEVQNSFVYHDEDGKEQLFTVDHELIGKIYLASEVMSSMGFIDSDKISPCDYDGNHYFITVQSDSKTKITDSNDIKAYSTLYYIASTMKQHLLVKFVSGDREKIATIYAHKGCLMLSTLLHSNYQRMVPEVEKGDLPFNIEQLAKKLVQSQHLNMFPIEDTCDKYEERIRDYIRTVREEAIKGKKAGFKITLKPIAIKPVADDFFSMLENLPVS